MRILFCQLTRFRLQPRLHTVHEDVRLRLVVAESSETGECGVHVVLSLSPVVLQRTTLRHLHHRIPSGTSTVCRKQRASHLLPPNCRRRSGRYGSLTFEGSRSWL